MAEHHHPMLILDHIRCFLILVLSHERYAYSIPIA
jgi:hypothetical protein